MAASEDLSAELIKFNAFLAAEQDRERQARDQKKATRLREQAAAVLKSVMADTGSSKETRADAEAAWKAAVAAEERVKAGGPLEDPAAEAAAGADDAADAAGADDAADAADADDAADAAGAAETPDANESPDADAESDGSPTGESAAQEPATGAPDGRHDTASTPEEAAAASGGDPDLTEIPEAGSDAPADP